MSAIIAMFFYSLSMSISPGPVNLVTLSSGVNYGFRSTLPFVLGATIGFNLLLLAIGLGFGQLAMGNKLFMQGVAILGTAFLIFMGYKLATSTTEVELETHDKPSFQQGFLLQWLNPKAWIACLAGISAFSLSGSLWMLFLFVSIYFVVCFFSIATWAFMGNAISQYLQSPKVLKRFNITMGVMLILVALYLLISQIII